MSKGLALGILFLLFIAHYPFLTADPDRGVDLHTRGAWTDEGLYSSQIRNHIINGEFSIKESSTFVRGPLFNIVQYPFFLAFGSKLIVSRLLVLFSVLLMLWLFIRKRETSTFTLVLVLLGMTQYHLFHFSHYGLSEMMSISLIMISLYIYIFNINTRSLPRNILIGFLIFLAYSMKIQFLYAAAILPLTILISSILQFLKTKKILTLKPFIQSCCIAIAFFLAYFIWYLVNKEFYDYVMLSEVDGRYPDGFGNLLPVARFNFNFFLWVRELKTVWISFFISLPILAYFLYKKEICQLYQHILLFAACWIVLELHKLPMTYIPNRYLLSLYLPVLIIVCVTITLLFKSSSLRKVMAVIIIAVLMGFQGKELLHSYKNRSYDLQTANHYLKSCGLDNELAIGSWVSAINWDTPVLGIPLWNNYFNWKNPIEQYKPRLVITEDDQADVELAFKQQNINLAEMSDSVRTFSFWRYKVKCYWIKPQ